MGTQKNKTKRFNDMRRRRGHGNKTRRKEKTRARKTRARKTRARKTRARKTRARKTRARKTRARKTRARGLCSSKEEVPTLLAIQQKLEEQENEMKRNNKNTIVYGNAADDMSKFLSRPRTLKQAKRVHKMTSNAIKDDCSSRHEKLKTKHLADTAERRRRYYERKQ